MISYKVYPSIDHIEPEMQAPLAELLSREVPNLQWLREKDRFSHQDTSYYLFFKADNNCLIGILRPVIRELSTKKKSFFYRLLNPASPQKWLTIQSPGASGHGFIFDPKYEHVAISKILELMNRKVNSDYDLIQLTVPKHLSFDFSYRAHMTEWSIHNILHKHPEYDPGSLPPKLREKIQQEEDILSSSTRYEIVSSEHFAKIFQKNKPRNTIAQKMQRHLSLAYYEKIPARFWALYDKDHLLTIAVYLKGIKGQAFGDMIFNLDCEINSALHYALLQKLITQFYQSQEEQTLRLLNTFHWPIELQKNLPALRFSACFGKTYIIPIIGKKSKKNRHRKPHTPLLFGDESRAGR